MRDVELFGHVSRDANFATAALLPSLRGRDFFVLMLPDLEGDAVDFESLPSQKEGGNGAIDSPTHTEENGWT